MNTKRLFITLFSVVIALSAALVTAQGDSLLLTLTSPDATHPVQFQQIAPGDVPTAAGFTSMLAIPANDDLGANIIYVAIENTGWSTGVIGLQSATLDPDAWYVALEVDADGVPVDGGLAFDLIPDSDLDGFVLPVLIAQTRTFTVFRVVEDAGSAFTGQTNVREDDRVTQREVEIMIDPDPVFAPLVLDCHIVARPNPVAEPETDIDSDGVWGMCGSCDTCGHTGKCLLSPAGECLWDPGTCGVVPGDAGGDDPEDWDDDSGNGQG